MLWITIRCQFHFDAYSLTNQRRAGKSTSNMPRVFNAHESQEQHYTQV